MKFLPILLACFSLLAALEVPKEGDVPVPFILKDQFGKERTVGKETRLLFFTPDKKATKIMEALLRARPGLLEAERAVYVADLTAVPSFVIRGYILPAWRELPYSILVIDDELIQVIFPSRLEHVSVIRMEEGTIRSIRYLASPEEF